MAKREFLLLAHTLEDFTTNYIGGWFLSEKMDGLRVFWDGGISRGIPAKEVPYANTEKDDRYINPDYDATGLWSRNGKVIQAPAWFLDRLPTFPLDGELWAGHQEWEQTASIVRRINPNSLDWQRIKYHIFDSPPLQVVFSPGEIDTSFYKKTFDSNTLNWVLGRASKIGVEWELRYREFEFVQSILKQKEIENESVTVLEQIRLPHDRTAYETIINRKMDEVMGWKGEGLMVRKDCSYWAPERSHNLLKIKKWYDSEAAVVGYVWGRQTTKGSKLLGKMGALVVEWEGKVFELSGFTFLEREMTFVSNGTSASQIGQVNPGKTVGVGIINPKFPLGSKVTFRYRDISSKGIPKGAQYLRKAIEE